MKIELVRRFPQQLRLAREHGCDVALRDVVEERHQLLTNTVTAKRWVVVALVVDHREAELHAQAMGLPSTQGQDRPAVPSHCAETLEPRTAQEVQQHGFGLIIGRMAQERVGREGLVASAAGARFEIRSGGHLDARLPGTPRPVAWPPRPRRPLRPPSRRATRGRRERPSRHNLRTQTTPAWPSSRDRPTPHS